MADVVTSQVLENGAGPNGRWVAKFTNFSDSTGESGVVKVNATSGGPYGVTVGGQTFYPGIHLTVTEIWWSVQGMTLRIQWKSNSSADMLVLQGWGDWKFRDARGGFGGLINPNLTGADGSIQFTTSGQIAGSSYSIVMGGLKGVPQS